MSTQNPDIIQRIPYFFTYTWNWSNTSSIEMEMQNNITISIVNPSINSTRYIKLTNSLDIYTFSITGQSTPSVINGNTLYKITTDSAGIVTTVRLLPTDYFPSSYAYSPAVSTADIVLDSQYLPVTSSLTAWGDFQQTVNTVTPSTVSSAINDRTAVSFTSDSLELVTTRKVKAAMFVVKGLVNTTNPIFSSSESTPVGKALVSTAGVYDVDISGVSGSTIYWGLTSINGSVPIVGDKCNTSVVLNTTDTYLIYISFNNAINLKYLGKSGTSFANYKLGEFITWDVQPEQLEVDRMSAYLAHKWDVALPSSHPFQNKMPIDGQAPSYTRVDNNTDLLSALSAKVPGTTIYLANGTYQIPSRQDLAAYTQIIGEGENTIIEPEATWVSDFADVASGGTEAYTDYLFSHSSSGVNSNFKGNLTFTDLTLTAPDIHGAIYTSYIKNLTVLRSTIKLCGWSGIRYKNSTYLKVDSCKFIDAGSTKAVVAGSIYGEFVKDSVISNTSFRNTLSSYKSVGFKSDGCSTVTISNCELKSGGFSIEVPFKQNDYGNVVQNCILGHATSIPKGGNGGEVFFTDYTRDSNTGVCTLNGKTAWKFKNCRFQNGYAIEFHRNSTEIDTCVAFPLDSGQSNFVSQFGTTIKGLGPTLIHDSWFKVGRGIFWADGGTERLHVINNRIESISTSTTDGFIGLKSDATINYASCNVKNNIFDATAKAKPLMRNSLTQQNVVIENNTMINVTDTSTYTNTQTSNPIGPVATPVFDAGVNGQYHIDGWTITPAWV